MIKKIISAFKPKPIEAIWVLADLSYEGHDDNKKAYLYLARFKRGIEEKVVHYYFHNSKPFEKVEALALADAKKLNKV